MSIDVPVVCVLLSCNLPDNAVIVNIEPLLALGVPAVGAEPE